MGGSAGPSAGDCEGTKWGNGDGWGANGTIHRKDGGQEGLGQRRVWGWVRAEEGRELQGVAQAGSEPTLALKMGAQVPTEAR